MFILKVKLGLYARENSSLAAGILQDYRDMKRHERSNNV